MNRRAAFLRRCLILSLPLSLTAAQVDAPAELTDVMPAGATVPCLDTQAAAASLRLQTPLPWQWVTSPLLVQGAARGPWYFEGSFPVRLVVDGTEIAYASARAQGEWTTETFVPFAADLTFLETGRAVLVLEKDNPSGLAENAAGLCVPVVLVATEK